MLPRLCLPIAPDVFALQVRDLVTRIVDLLKPLRDHGPRRLARLFKASVVTDDYGNQLDLRPRGEVETLTRHDWRLVKRAWSHFPRKPWSEITEDEFHQHYGPALDEAAQHCGWVAAVDMPDWDFAARVSRVILRERILEDVFRAASTGGLVLLNDARLPLPLVGRNQVPDAYLSVAEASRWFEAMGLTLERSTATDVRASSVAEDADLRATMLGIRKRAALVQEFRRVWPTLERDLRDAAQNGLRQAAGAGMPFGQWDADRAVAWARERGKLVNPPARRVGPSWSPL